MAGDQAAVTFQLGWLRARGDMLEAMLVAHVVCQELHLRKRKSKAVAPLRADARMRRLPRSFRKVAAAFQALLRSCLGWDGHTCAVLRSQAQLCRLLAHAFELCMGKAAPIKTTTKEKDVLGAMAGNQSGAPVPGQQPITCLIRRLSTQLSTMHGQKAFLPSALSAAASANMLSAILSSVMTVPFPIPRRFFSFRPSAQAFVELLPPPQQAASGPALTPKAQRQRARDEPLLPCGLIWGSHGTYEYAAQQHSAAGAAVAEGVAGCKVATGLRHDKVWRSKGL
eukprot:TRINITY_DN3758_c0_g1_i4.p1 TRINITY_DN3758_c0_g1~~TRINITY_DN3758_c0_g1_i4.p1  ORF type:complete len:282 (-),score=55.36 TRINITY_DN3758_c0_g1_i4:1219-2064(-)